MMQAPVAEQPDGHASKQQEKSTKNRLEATLSKELEHHGYNSIQEIENNLSAKGRGVFKASGKDKPTVAMRVYTLSGGVNLEDVCAEVLHQSSLHHPHIVQPKSLIRTPHFLCIALEYANGGDVYRLARRAGAAGLPLPAARFIFQQLVLTLDFAHDFGIFLCRINPSNVLVFWNDRGMPILKIADFRLSRPQVKITDWSTPVVGTMYTCPQQIRQAEGPAGGPEQVHALAAASDVWAACVTFYFLLFARWPFDKRQIAAWAVMAREVWRDDADVEYPEKERPDELKGIVELFQSVFAKGRLPVEEFVSKGPTLAEIQAALWFKIDLPDGAADMKQTYSGKTRDRMESPAFGNLKGLLKDAVSPDVTHLSAKMEATSLHDAPVGK